MAVWDIADDDIDRVAALFLRHPQVTLCYRRARARPDWPYNLFCMVHAKTHEDACTAIAAINRTAGTANVPQAILFSRQCFKQRGARFSQPTGLAQ
jgi:DNA-binding Lrp family transcriptional regulator